MKTLSDAVARAVLYHDGHLTIMRFTTEWRVAFGTLDPATYDEWRAQIEGMPKGGTLEEAIAAAFDDDESAPGDKMSEALPAVKVVLLKNEHYQQPLFRVLCCPFCGGVHVHGAGAPGEDPADFATTRQSHCSPGGEYQLEWDGAVK